MPAAAAAGVALRVPRWGIGDAVVALVGSFAIGLAVSGATGLAGWSGPWVILAGAVLPWLAIAGWPVLATRRFGNGPRIDLGLSFTVRDGATGLFGGIVSLTLGLAAVQLTELVLGPIESSAGRAGDAVAESGSRLAVILFALVVAVGAPVVEEIGFRGMLWASLCRAGLAPWVTLVVTTLAFAAFHFEPHRLLVLLTTGLVLGFLRLSTRRLGAPIVAHAVNNSAGALTLVF